MVFSYLFSTPLYLFIYLFSPRIDPVSKKQIIAFLVWIPVRNIFSFVPLGEIVKRLSLQLFLAFGLFE